MTYCLGILLDDGLVLAADSRTNAGVDQIALTRKLTFFHRDGDRMLGLMSAGNLATAQAVVALLHQDCDDGGQTSLMSVPTMFGAAQLVGDTLRRVMARDGKFVKPFGNPEASFILAGQIAGESHRLFEIYSAGNFIEAGDDTPFLQIGETKYGKPILVRMIRHDSNLLDACKCALLSMDATIRSNLSVAPPIDLLCYRRDSLVPQIYSRIEDADAYLNRLRDGYGNGLRDLFHALPQPPWL
jgi:putative proteasome-type protease